MSVVLSVRKWERFQHYKDRDPPWVKLYRDLLTSESWVLGNDLSRVLQVASTLLAPRYENKIPYRFDLLKKVMTLECSEAAFKKAIDHLIETKFLEIHHVTMSDEVVEQSASASLASCTSETETDQSRGEKKRINGLNGHSSALPTDVTAVFDHWKREHSHPQAQLTDKRLRIIRIALKAYTPEQLCQSISGYRNSPHHMGQNVQKTVYDSIELFLRDAEHIDRGLKLAGQGSAERWQ